MKPRAFARRVGAASQRLVLLITFLLGSATTATAQTASWATDANVGPNEVEVTLAISCPAQSFVCDLIDGYWDMQTSAVTGSGTFDVDAVADALRFETDGLEDVGAGLQPVYGRVSGNPLSFALVPFAGVPEIDNLLVFALTDAALAAPGLELLPPADHPFSGSLDYAAKADVIGDLELALGEIVVPGQPSAVGGILRNLGDPDTDGFFELELRDYTASATVQQPSNIGGEPVVITVTADLTLNLSGELAGAPPPVPAAGWWARLLLIVGLMVGAAFILARRTR